MVYRPLAIAAMGVSAKVLAMDASLPMKAADVDPAFQKAFNAGDPDTLLKLYDEQRVLVAEPGKPVQGLDNIKQALIGYLALKLPIRLTVRHVYENGDIGFLHRRLEHCRQTPDGKDVKVDIGGGGQEDLGRQLGIRDR
jgi:ketosteroid isomerase-like protein